MNKMVIYFYLLIPLAILSAVDSSSIRGRNFKNDLVPFLSSRPDPLKKDNSLKIVSNEPFIIQFQVPNPSEAEVGETGAKGRDKKKKRGSKKRDSKLRSLRKKHRIRRDLENPDVDFAGSEESLTDDATNSVNDTAARNAITREEIFKTLTQITSKKNKTPDSRENDYTDVERSKTNGITYRLHLPPSDSIPIVKMVYPSTPKTQKRAHKYTNRDMMVDRERLEQKIKYLKNMLKINDTDAPDDGLRVRRKTDPDKTANKIAKMFLTLSAVNGLHDKKKSRCKLDEEDSRENVWEKEMKNGLGRRSSSANEERYKLKKWVEFMKSKRSSRTCPCMANASGEEKEVFPLELKLAKGNSPLDSGGSSEESIESLRSEGPYSSAPRTRPGYYRRSYSQDESKPLAKSGKGKLVMPIDDLEVYRTRAKQILQNAEEILDKIREEEEKRKSTPNILMSHLKELTSRIQADPRNNENDLIRLLQKNLGWSPLSRAENGAQGNAFVDNVKSFILDPYEKAKALTDESTKKLSSYLLRNLGNLKDSAEEPDEVQKTADEPDRKSSRICQDQERLREGEELTSANLAKENYDSEKKSGLSPQQEFENGAREPQNNEDDQEETIKRIIVEEENLRRRMQDMLKEQEKKINAFTDAPNLEPNSEEFENIKKAKDKNIDRYPLLERGKDEKPVIGHSTADRGKGTEKKIKLPKGTKKTLKKTPARGQLGKLSSKDLDEDEENTRIQDNRGGKSKTDAEDAVFVARENLQVEGSGDERKSQEKTDDVTAAEHSGSSQETVQKSKDGHEDQKKGRTTSAEYELDKGDDNVGADKVLDFEDLENLKAEIQSREQELTKGEPRKEDVAAEMPSSSEGPEENSRKTQSGGERSQVLQSTHESDSQENEQHQNGGHESGFAENPTRSAEDPIDREENDVIQSKHLTAKEDQEPSQENSNREDGLTGSEQPSSKGEINEKETETSQDSNKAKGNEETVMERQVRLESTEKDYESEEDKKNTEKLSGGIVTFQETTEDAAGKEENVQSELLAEPEKQDSIKSAKVKEESNDSVFAEADDQEAENPVNEQESIIGDRSQKPSGSSSTSNEKTEENPVEEDKEQTLLKASPSESEIGSDEQEETLQAANPEGSQNVSDEGYSSDSEEKPLRASKPEETNNRKSTMEGESNESTLRAENPSENTPSRDQDSGDENDDEPSMRATGSDETSNKEANQESISAEDEESSLKATNPEVRSNNQPDVEEGSDEKSDGETSLRAAKPTEKMENVMSEEDSSEGETVESPLERSDEDETTIRAEKAGDASGKESENRAESDDDDDNKENLMAAHPNNVEGEEENDVASSEATSTGMKSHKQPRQRTQTSDQDDEDSEEASLKAINAGGDLDKGRENEEEVESSLSLEKKEKSNEQSEESLVDEKNEETSLKATRFLEDKKERPEDQVKSGNVDDDDEDTSLKRANVAEEKNEQSASDVSDESDDTTPLQATNLEKNQKNQDESSEELGERLRAVDPHKKVISQEEENENFNEGKINDGALRSAEVDLNNELDQDNLNEDVRDRIPLRASKPTEEMIDSEAEDKMKEADNDQGLLREANADDDFNNELEESSEKLSRKNNDEGLLRHGNTDEVSNNQLVAQEQLAGAEAGESALKSANLEKAFDDKLEDQNESRLRSHNADGAFSKETEEGMNDETTLKATNPGETSKETEEDNLVDENNDGTPLKEVHMGDASNENASMNDETLKAENPGNNEVDETNEEDSDETSLKGQVTEKRDYKNVHKVDETPFTAVRDNENEAEEPHVKSSKPIEDKDNDNQTSDESSGTDNADEVNLRAEKPDDIWHLRVDEENSDESNSNELYLKSANPPEELNRPRYKQGEEEENLSEDHDDSLRASNPLEELKQENNRPPSSSDPVVKALEGQSKSSKTSDLKVPKSIGEIMKDLEGVEEEKGDIPSIQNLDPKKIDHIIDKIQEAEQENIIDSEVDCQKECKCSEKISTRSRNIGRYEIVKDFLHWVKDLQMNRVLTDN